MAKIAVVTDSTADIDKKLAEELGIQVIPLNVHFGDELYKDNIDITPEPFYAKLKDTPTPPKTSQPSPGDFHEVYKSLLDQGVTGIISIHISQVLSGTFQSATIAKDMLPDADIRIVNSKAASMALGLIVLNVARAIAQGADLDAAHKLAERLTDSQQVVFAVDTLEYLHRNGRIGRAQKLIGGMLNVKPILHLDEEGYVAARAKVRGKGKVIPYILEESVAFAGEQEVDVAIGHALNPQLAEEMSDALKKEINIRNLEIATIGSVIGTHTGPGTIAVVIQKI